jgi:hypothetical protein
MKSSTLIRFGAVLAFAGAIGALGGLALAEQPSVAPVAVPAGVRPPGVHPTPSPRYFRTGGPYLGQSAAIDLASAVATTPVTRSEAHLLSYGEIVAWIGSENLYYDRGREMYLVGVSGAYVPRTPSIAEPITCNSYFEVIDATDGTVLSVGCGGSSTWPANLPAVFTH